MSLTFDGVIDAAGGTGSVAGALGVDPSTVSSWKSRASIPAGYWKRIIRLATMRGRNEITFEALAALHETRPAAPEPAEARP